MTEQLTLHKNLGGRGEIWALPSQLDEMGRNWAGTALEALPFLRRGQRSISFSLQEGEQEVNLFLAMQGEVPCHNQGLGDWRFIPVCGIWKARYVLSKFHGGASVFEPWVFCHPTNSTDYSGWRPRVGFGKLWGVSHRALLFSNLSFASTNTGCICVSQALCIGLH